MVGLLALASVAIVVAGQRGPTSTDGATEEAVAEPSPAEPAPDSPEVERARARIERTRELARAGKLLEAIGALEVLLLEPEVEASSVLRATVLLDQQRLEDVLRLDDLRFFLLRQSFRQLQSSLDSRGCLSLHVTALC